MREDRPRWQAYTLHHMRRCWDLGRLPVSPTPEQGSPMLASRSVPAQTKRGHSLADTPERIKSPSESPVTVTS